MPATYIERCSKWWRDLSILHKGTAIILIPMSCVLWQGLWMAEMNRQAEDARNWSFHTQEVQLEAGGVLSALLDVESGARGFTIAREPQFLDPYHNGSQVLPGSLARLQQLVSDNPAQRARAAEIARLAQERLALADSTIAASRLLPPAQLAPLPPEILRMMREGTAVMNEIRSRMAQFIGEETNLLEGRNRRLQQREATIRRGLAISAAVAVLGGILVLYVFTTSVVRRLLRVRLQAQAMEKGMPLQGSVAAKDEIGQLEKSFQRAAEMIAERERTLTVRTQELERANSELEAFSYSVSHDLRSPLRHIDGYSRILQQEEEDRLSPEGQRLLERIRNGTQHMGSLIDELLQLSRVGRRELSRQITGLRSLVEEAQQQLRSECEGRSVQWQIGELGFGDCDPALMRQVFMNLLSNAVKYTRPRAQAIITVEQQRQQGEIVISVRDNGVGFSMQYADKLFGAFQRLHRAEDFEGTGVGLATAARIIQKHGGRIWAEAELDRGATFFFSLPAAPVATVSAVNSGNHPMLTTECKS